MDAKKFKELQMLMAEGDSEQVPEGYYSRQEISERIGKSQVTADRFIAKCVIAGSMKKLFIRRPTNAGVRSTPYFSFPTAIVGSAKLNRRPQGKR